ncbi:MAG: hypothetical protein ACK56I_22225, partial [bacterium]
QQRGVDPYYIMKEYAKFSDDYYSILYYIAKEINMSNGVNTKDDINPFALSISLFMSKYICREPVVLSVNDCHVMRIDMSKFDENPTDDVQTRPGKKRIRETIT